MTINSDINILGSLSDWNLVQIFLNEDLKSLQEKGGIHNFTSIKTNKSIRLFEKAIKNTLLKCKNENVHSILSQSIVQSGITSDSLLLLFWNASLNNSLFFYLNETVFFPAFYSRRSVIKKDEIVPCILELKQSQDSLKRWSNNTINTTASKYLTLLKKFGLLEGTVNKRINHPYLSDDMFIRFTYWMLAIAEKPNLLSSNWIKYSFTEKQIFIDRLFQKKFTKYFTIHFTGDNLMIQPILPYESIYEHSHKS